MSNIYIQEPPTSGKVMLKTTIGDIDIELWTREAPKACRNFIKLCYDGYYNDTIFHRVVKGFIVQGGDPLGTGEGGESIYGQPFKDEFHSRLRFCRRGLVAMANAGKDDNGSQFFFTLNATPELQNKHTIFGKIAGETLYNVLKFEECLVDKDDRPIYPPKIVKTQVLSNPFEDIVPSEASKERDEKKEAEKGRKKDKKGVKDFKLLSFGEEAEEDEEEFKELNKKFSGKSKSAHDVLDDPKLSSEPALEQASSSNKKRKDDRNSDESDDEVKTEDELANLNKKREISDRVIEKLKGTKNPKGKTSKKFKADEDEEEVGEYYLGKDHADERKRMAEAIKKEIREFKRGVQKEKTKADEATEKEKQVEKEKIERAEVKKELEEQQKKYREENKKIKSLGDDFIMQKLMKFRNKIHTMKEKYNDDSEESEVTKKKDDDEVIDETILAHTLHCEDKTPVLAKDANLKNDDWFEIYDPRNPINKRRRGETSKKGDSDRGKHRPPRA